MLCKIWTKIKIYALYNAFKSQGKQLIWYVKMYVQEGVGIGVGGGGGA